VRTEWFEGLQPETPDQAIELARQCLQIAAGLVELIGDMAGADGQLVDVDDIAVDVLDHARLLFGGGSDLDVLIADLADMAVDLFRCVTPLRPWRASARRY